MDHFLFPFISTTKLTTLTFFAHLARKRTPTFVILTVHVCVCAAKKKSLLTATFVTRSSVQTEDG